MQELGGRCCDCGSTEKLEFDCIVPRGHKHHRIEMSHRMSFYNEQHRQKNLAIRCQVCNAIKGDRMPEEAYPF